MSAYQPRIARVPIYQGPDLARLESLDDAVKRAENAVSAAEKAAEKAAGSPTPQLPRLLGDQPRGDTSGTDPVTEARAAHALAVVERDTFAAEAQERGVIVHLVARPRLRWRQLMKDHPARPDVDDDKMFGVNMESLPDVLLIESIDTEKSTIDGDVHVFLESLSDYDYYDQLFVNAWAINRGSAPADPTQRLLSASSQT